MVAWIGFARDDVNFSAPPKEFCSSEGVVRGFCGDCGSPMFFQSEKWPDEIHLYAASLNDPSRANPTTHYFFSQRLEWVEIEDELEKQG